MLAPLLESQEAVAGQSHASPDLGIVLFLSIRPNGAQLILGRDDIPHREWSGIAV